MNTPQQPEETPEPTLHLPELEAKGPGDTLPPAFSGSDTYIGAYRLVKMLGDGAFGIVHLAYQPFLDRQVALKVLHPELNTEARSESQFMHEARTIAKLRHPNIVSVYEFGTTSHEHTHQTYMAMEYLPGETLYARLRRERLSLLQVVEIIEQLASALDYAHARRVIHRDLKPANIIFSDQQQPVIVDFGLARLAEISVSRDIPEATLQNTSLVGTPTYMAPEQASGRAGGPAADEYALALIAFEMLTGRPAFRANSLQEMLEAKLNGEPPSLRAAMPELPPEADAVMLRALHRDPVERYLTAGAFARALGEALLPERVAGKVITVIDPVQAAQLRSARQTIRGFLWGVVLLTLILIVFSIALFSRSFLNSDPPFMWDGIIASTSTHDGLHDVIGFWPDSSAQKAGVQVGDTIRADIANNRLDKNGDYTINGQPRSAYPVNWQPQEGDIMGRIFVRDGRPVQITYPIQRSGYLLFQLAVQLIPAVLIFFGAIWLLRRWGVEPGAQFFIIVLLAACFAVVASGVDDVLRNLDSVALFTFLPLLIHLVLVFPEPARWLENHPRRIWLLYLPLPLAFGEFMVGAGIFDQFNLIIYAAYIALLLVILILKWVRHDLKRFPALWLLISSVLLASLTAAIAEVVTALDDYVTVRSIWNGNGLTLELFAIVIVPLGASLAILFCTLGFDRVQRALGPSIPPVSSSAGKSVQGESWPSTHRP